MNIQDLESVMDVIDSFRREKKEGKDDLYNQAINDLIVFFSVRAVRLEKKQILAHHSQDGRSES